MPRTATFAAIQRYVLSCGLLLVPASVWNIALTERLPFILRSRRVLAGHSCAPGVGRRQSASRCVRPSVLHATRPCSARSQACIVHLRCWHFGLLRKLAYAHPVSGLGVVNECFRVCGAGVYALHLASRHSIARPPIVLGHVLSLVDVLRPRGCLSRYGYFAHGTGLCSQPPVAFSCA